MGLIKVSLFFFLMLFNKVVQRTKTCLNTGFNAKIQLHESILIEKSVFWDTVLCFGKIYIKTRIKNSNNLVLNEL